MSEERLVTTLAVLVPVIFVVLFFWALSSFLAARCEDQWSQFKPSYTLMQQCMIEVDGKRIPESAYRVQP